MRKKVRLSARLMRVKPENKALRRSTVDCEQDKQDSSGPEQVAAAVEADIGGESPQEAPALY